MSSIFFGSFVKSISPGTLACMRNAISYWAIRVVISGSATRLVVLAVERLRRVDDIALLAPR